jgi:hypothetical protein
MTASIRLPPVLARQESDVIIWRAARAHSLVNVIPENTPGRGGRSDLGLAPQ